MCLVHGDAGSSAVGPAPPSSLLEAPPPPVAPPPIAYWHALRGVLGSERHACKAVTVTMDKMRKSIVGLQHKTFCSLTASRALTVHYWVIKGRETGGARPPPLILLPGLREGIESQARLGVTLSIPTADIYMLELATSSDRVRKMVQSLDEQAAPPTGDRTGSRADVNNACDLLDGLVDHLTSSGQLTADESSAHHGFVLVGFSTGAHVAYTYASRLGESGGVRSGAIKSDRPALRAIGLIHPAGECLSDALLARLRATALKGAPGGFPFAWEDVEACGECLSWTSTGPKLPRWLQRGLVAQAAARFPRGYWSNIIGEWAQDYRLLAVQSEDGGSGGVAHALDGELSVFRAFAAERGVRALVLGSRADTVCSERKMAEWLTPALGPTARFEQLPGETTGHTTCGDKKNTHIYELAGPVVGRWLVEEVLAYM